MPSRTDVRPPFDLDGARREVQAAQDAWNARDPDRVVLAYTVDTEWRNRDTFLRGRDEVAAFLRDEWQRGLDYRLERALWAFGPDRIAVRFEYESRDRAGQWRGTRLEVSSLTGADGHGRAPTGDSPTLGSL